MPVFRTQSAKQCFTTLNETPQSCGSGNIFMTDTFTKDQRSRCMSRIRSKHTGPEIAVRKLLTELGIRYRLHVKKYPGTPDIIISKIKTAIFINGCFWHQHKGCKRSSIPKTNIQYWEPKLVRNVRRQKEHVKALRKLGWQVSTVWECQTKDVLRLRKKLLKIIEK